MTSLGPTANGAQRGSLRTHIVVPVAVIMVITVAALFIFTRHILLDGVTQRANADVTQELDEFERFAHEAVDPTTGEPFHDARTLITTFMSRQIPGDNETFLGLVDGSRGLIQPDFTAQAGAQRPAPLSIQSPLVKEIREAPESAGVVDEPDLGPIHWGRVRIQVGESEQESTFAVASFVAEDRAKIESQMRLLGLTGLGLGLAGIVALWWLVGRAVQPIRTLERATSSITAAHLSSKDLTARMPVDGPEEISRLSASFNAMLARLETAYRDQRTFVDDAGHELRTPITVVRGQLELLESSPEEERARSIELATAELDRMSRMVEDLLILAVADAGVLAHPASVDLAELTIDIEDKAATISDRVTLVEVAEGTAFLDEQRVTQAVLELCRNALRYSEEAVEIGSTVTTHHVRFWVKDRGPGIPAEQQTSLFSRFTRGEQPSTGRPQGAGLGLSIVDAIARAHGGEPFIESTPGLGSIIGISLPLSASPSKETPCLPS